MSIASEIEAVDNLLEGTGALAPSSPNGASMTPYEDRGGESTKQVKQVPRNGMKSDLMNPNIPSDMTPAEIENVLRTGRLAGRDLSTMADAHFLKPMRGPTQEQVAYLVQVRDYLRQEWNAAQELLTQGENALQAGDPGRSAHLKQEAGVRWASCKEYRRMYDAAQARLQQEAAFNQGLALRKDLLKQCPWLADKEELQRAVKWAAKKHGITEEEVIRTQDPNLILQTAQAYASYRKTLGRRLAKGVDRKTEGVKAKADRIRKQKGRLSTGDQAALVAELLRGKA